MALFLGHTEISLVGPPIAERSTSSTWTKLTSATILLWRSSTKTFQTSTTNLLRRFLNSKDRYWRARIEMRKIVVQRMMNVERGRKDKKKRGREDASEGQATP